MPDPTWDFSDLSRLHRAVDEKCQQQEALGGVVCRKGCHHCCRRIPTVLPVEFAFLVDGPKAPFDAAQGGSRSASGGGLGLRSELHPGELLCDRLAADGSCRIYPSRPLICRTHGFLHLSEEGLDHCPWNFQELEEVDEDLPFRLETLHETLLRVNLAFLRKSYPTRWKDLAEVRIAFQ